MKDKIQALRQEARLEGKEFINKSKLTNNLPGKYNYDQAKTTSMHLLMPQEKLDYLIQNDLPIDGVYEEILNKHNRDGNKSM